MVAKLSAFDFKTVLKTFSISLSFCFTFFDIIRAMKTMERTFTIDRDLAQKASRKLRRYGHTLDDALEYALTVVVSVRGNPSVVFNGSVAYETPGSRLLSSFHEADQMERGEIPMKRYAKTEDMISDCLK